MQKVQSRIVVSVPVYNEEAYILQALESLAAQTHTDFQVLVADNASTDDTGRLCEAFCARDTRFHYVRHAHNLGGAANFRYCLEHTESEFFMWLGAHDALAPEFLASAYARMLANDGTSLVYAHTRWINERGELIRHSNGGNYVFAEPLQAHTRYLRLLNALDRCEAVNQLIRRRFLDAELVRPVVSFDLAVLCHLAGHGPFERIDAPLYIRRDFAQRASSSMERTAGSGSVARYHLLAELFVHSVSTHAAIAPEHKLETISQVLGWIDRRFRLFQERIEPLASYVAPAPDLLAQPAPLFSVVVPMYNRERYVEEAIDSILAQDDGDFELIVVDDGSSDRSTQIVEAIADPRIRLLRNQHAGGAAARNTGIAAARGEFVVWIDSDDRQAPGALAALREAIAACPDADVYYGDLEIFDDTQPDKRFLTQYPDYIGESLLPRLIRGNCLPNPGTAVRRTLYQQHGGYDTTFVRCHDFHMWTRLAGSARFKKVARVQCHWRQHGASLSSAKTRAFEAKVALDMVQRYPPQRLFPDLRDDANGRGTALWRVAETVNALGEPAQALHAAYRAAAFGVGDRARIRELERLAGSDYAPFFSVVLTTFNRPALLADALASLDQQGFRDFEAIVVNDHGQPAEPQPDAYGFALSYLQQGRNQGPAAARNAAHRLARGRYIVYLDDDDRFLPEHLQTLADALDAHPDTVAYSDALFVAEKIEDGVRHDLGSERRYQHEEYSRERLLVDNYIPVNTFAWPRALAAKVGGFDERMAGLEDWEFLLRLAAAAPFRHVPRTTVQVRMRVETGAPERRSEQALKDYPKLYTEIYARHPDLDNEQIRQQRTAKLRQLGVAVKPAPGKLLQHWLEARTPSPAQTTLITQRLQAHDGGPRIGVLVLDLRGDAAAVAKTLASLAPETMPVPLQVQARVLSSADDAADRGWSATTAEAHIAAINREVDALACDWVMVVDAGQRFLASGLMVLAVELTSASEMHAVYADTLVDNGRGALNALFRPDVNLDMLLSLPGVMARHWLFRRNALVDAGGFDPALADAAEFDLLLRLIGNDGLHRLGHVAEPLLVCRPPALATRPNDLVALRRHLAERGYAQATISAPHPGCYRIAYGHAGTPGVSIVVPVRHPLDKLRRCIETLLEKTAYTNYELLIVDAGSDEDGVAEWLAGIEALGSAQLRVLREATARTPSAMINLAAGEARGEYLLLLDSDTVVLREDWLDALLNHAQRPEVGVVGPKMLQANGSIQDAGLVLGLNGPAGPAFRNDKLNAAGNLYRLQVDQDYSAVSGACLMVRKALFAEVGGLDQDALADAYSDVDLCLKVRNAGYLVVWTPHALLLHDGDAAPDASQPGVPEPPPTPAAQDTMYARWLPWISRDPAYNRNMTLDGKGFTVDINLQRNWHPLASWRPLPVVVALAADQQGCGQYRVIQPVQAMNDFGLADAEWSQRYYSPVELERRSPDVVVLQRQMFENQIEPQQRLARLSRAFRVAELDDYLPLLPRKSIHHGKLPKDVLRTMRETLKLVDRFVVSTAPLAEALDGLHDDIRVVENRLPLPWWQHVQGARRRGSKLRVGWGGGAGHRGDLELIADVVRALADEVEWVFFGMCPEALRPHVHEYHPPVAIEDYPAKLAALDLDLALAPLEDNLFNRCKSNLRLLEYGACGFPVVCSDITPYQGALPVTRVKPRFRDWVDAIRMHAAERDATAAAGDALRAVVQRDWMLDQKHAASWLSQWTPD